MKKTSKTPFYLPLTLKILVTVIFFISSVKAAVLLSDTQIINQVERGHAGKVISLSKTREKDIFQIRILMPNADIFLLKIDPKTGKTLSKTKVSVTH